MMINPINKGTLLFPMADKTISKERFIEILRNQNYWFKNLKLDYISRPEYYVLRVIEG